MYFDLESVARYLQLPRDYFILLLEQHRIKIAQYKPHSNVFHHFSNDPFEKFKKFFHPLYFKMNKGRQFRLTIIMISCSVTDCGQMDLLPREEEYSAVSLGSGGG